MEANGESDSRTETEPPRTTSSRRIHASQHIQERAAKKNALIEKTTGGGVSVVMEFPAIDRLLARRATVGVVADPFVSFLHLEARSTAPIPIRPFASVRLPSGDDEDAGSVADSREREAATVFRDETESADDEDRGWAVDERSFGKEQQSSADDMRLGDDGVHTGGGTQGSHQDAGGRAGNAAAADDDDEFGGVLACVPLPPGFRARVVEDSLQRWRAQRRRWVLRLQYAGRSPEEILGTQPGTR